MHELILVTLGEVSLVLVTAICQAKPIMCIAQKNRVHRTCQYTVEK